MIAAAITPTADGGSTTQKGGARVQEEEGTVPSDNDLLELRKAELDLRKLDFHLPVGQQLPGKSTIKMRKKTDNRIRNADGSRKKIYAR